MTLSTFAMLLGITCYLFGFPLVFSEKKAVAWMKKWMKNDDSLRVVGAIMVFVTVLLLMHTWRLTWDAEGLVVLLAWLTLVKGLFFVWAPEIPSKLSLSFLTPATALLAGFALLVWGALLTFLGYILV